MAPLVLFSKCQFLFCEEVMFFIKLNLVFILFLTYSFCNNSFQKDSVAIIGYVDEHIFTTKKELRIAEKLWKKQIEQKGFKVKLIRIDSSEKAIKLFEDKKIIALLADSTFYYKYKKKLDLLSKHKWVVSKSEQNFNQYYLIKNLESEFSFNDLEKKEIYYNDHMAKMWFDYLLLKKNIESKKMINRIDKEKNLIFNIFFNKDNLSIITKDLYDDMIKFNPQIKEKIEIIEKSEAIFFKVLGYTRKGLSENDQEKLYKIINALNAKVEDFDVLSFIQIRKIHIVVKHELDKINKFFDEYNKIEKHTNK